MATLFILLSSLKQDDCNSIVQDGLAKNNGIKFRVNFVGVEDGKDGNWIGGR
jgi:hypothetical protein